MVGRAKSAIGEYGYSGDSYYSMYEALKELKARFGKPSLVAKSYTRQIDKDIANTE